MKQILGIYEEVAGQLQKYQEKVAVRILGDAGKLRQYLENPEHREGALLIAATDATIALGKAYCVATMAYENLAIMHQSYSGVDMIVEGFEEVDVNFLEKVYQRYHRIPWTIAQTSRCRIRELALEDLDDLFALYADEGIRRYTENLYPYEEERDFQSAYIEHMYRFYGYGMWLVFSRENGTLIGRVGLEHREYHGQTELELGYLIGTPFQRKGYAIEVCTKVMEIAREMTDFERLNCLIDVQNAPSVALAERLGFSFMEELELEGRKMKRYVFPLR